MLSLEDRSAGAWNVFYLQLHNVDFAANRARCPQTCATLDALPRVYGHTFFSVKKNAGVFFLLLFLRNDRNPSAGSLA